MARRVARWFVAYSEPGQTIHHTIFIPPFVALQKSIPRGTRAKIRRENTKTTTSSKAESELDLEVVDRPSPLKSNGELRMSMLCNALLDPLMKLPQGHETRGKVEGGGGRDGEGSLGVSLGVEVPTLRASPLVEHAAHAMDLRKEFGRRMETLRRVYEYEHLHDHSHHSPCAAPLITPNG
jgi:hypothetical protein